MLAAKILLGDVFESLACLDNCPQCPHLGFPAPMQSLSGTVSLEVGLGKLSWGMLGYLLLTQPPQVTTAPSHQILAAAIGFAPRSFAGPGEGASEHNTRIYPRSHRLCCSALCQRVISDRFLPTVHQPSALQPPVRRQVGDVVAVMNFHSSALCRYSLLGYCS